MRSSSTRCGCPSKIKMAAEREEVPPRRWYYSREQLSNSPSRADGVDPEKELRYRQDAASLIQDMGPKLNLWVFLPVLHTSLSVLLISSVLFSSHFMHLKYNQKSISNTNKPLYRGELGFYTQ